MYYSLKKQKHEPEENIKEAASESERNDDGESESEEQNEVE